MQQQPRLYQQQSPYPAPQASRPNRKPLIISASIIGLVLVAIVSGLGWYFFAPKSGTASDSNPFATATPGGSANPGTSGTAPASGPVVLATGQFIDTGSGDHGSGNVTIGKTADGKYVLHLDQLNVTAGPDLHVYLSTAANPGSADQVTNGGVDLGTLKANQGSVNVDISADVAARLQQQQFKSVVIYCKSFSVIFTVAPLQYTS